MAAPNADARLITGKRSWAPVGLWVISILCFLYIAFLYMVASNPAVRALGFGTVADVQQMSALFFIFLFFAALAVEHYAPEPQQRASGGSAPAPARGGARPQTRMQGAQISLKDPHARPGAPPPLSIPRVVPDQLEGGWQRWKFPSERTGGIYIDTDVVVDDLAPESSEDSSRGLHILRVRDEVARVCVRCDLIDHCHGKVRTLISRQDMLANSECVAGLRQIARAKIAARDAAVAAAAAAAAPAPSAAPAGAAPPVPEPPAPAADVPAPAGDPAAAPGEGPAPDTPQ